ncbi:MAG: hypothetical protein ABI999_08250 [Acidobacteriota bacterium]
MKIALNLGRQFDPRNYLGLLGGLCFALCSLGCGKPARTKPGDLKNVSTLAGFNREIGEPFGIALKNGAVYVSDGQNGKILTVSATGTIAAFAQGLDTPSGIAFDKNGDLLVADSGTSSIKKIDDAGKVSTIAGIDRNPGYADGNSDAAQFHAPIGIAAAGDGSIYVADTYNDRIRVIREGKVYTLAGGSRGFADGAGSLAKFNTPCGLTVLPSGDLLVADLGNRRIRLVQKTGETTTLLGTGTGELRDGPLGMADLIAPIALAVDQAGSIFVADGNAIRVIQNGLFPFVRTIEGNRRGLRDGQAKNAGFNRPSGIAVDASETVFIADSDNKLVRATSAGTIGKTIEPGEIEKLRMSAEEFRTAAPGRWPYDPPQAKREIAGTLGELRGEIGKDDSDVHFHNGLDVVGSYGETARFIRDEKVLLPLATQNFGTLREMIRMPTMGYIHIRLGRDQNERPLGDQRFLFDGTGKPTDVRVPRGSSFKAGEPIGTLNPFNHTHLIAGSSGSEMNALDALILPGISDGIAPTIDKVTLFDENWREIETGTTGGRIKLTGKVRVVVKAFDRMDGNADRRRLGVYSVGYALYDPAGNTIADHRNSINFKRMPDERSVPFVYAPGSRSGATGETVFNFIATNDVASDSFKEGFLDLTNFQAGPYSLRVFVSDYFGNTATKEIAFEVFK